MNANIVILHVEDDPNDVDLIGLAFRKAGVNCRLIAVNDGVQAVSYLAGEGDYEDRDLHPFPDFALLDIKLPRKSGLEVLSWTRAQRNPAIKRLPIIMLTSSSQANDVNTAYDLGVNSYLVKPGDLGMLIELVKTVFNYWVGLNMKPGREEVPVIARAGGSISAPDATPGAAPANWEPRITWVKREVA